MHKGLVAELAEATITVAGRFGMLNDRRWAKREISLKNSKDYSKKDTFAQNHNTT